MRRVSDTDEIDAMTCAVHQLICVPLIGSDHHYDQHRGTDPDDDVACRSRARFLVESLHIGGWRITEIAPLNDIEATGHCCCAGCIGMGPCDLDPISSEDEQYDLPGDEDWLTGTPEDLRELPGMWERADYTGGLDEVRPGGSVRTTRGDDTMSSPDERFDDAYWREIDDVRAAAKRLSELLALIGEQCAEIERLRAFLFRTDRAVIDAAAAADRAALSAPPEETTP